MAHRRNIIISLLTGNMISLAGCSQASQITQPSEEEVKEEAKSPSWEEIFRNNSNWVGEPIHYTSVNIVSITEKSGTFNMIIEHSGNDGFGSEKYLYCRWDGDPFQERDTVDMWGIVEGTHTYTSLTGEQTVPDIELVDIQLS